MARATLQISGMHCNSCEALIRDILADFSVKTISASHKTGRVEIDFDAKKVSRDAVTRAIEMEGDNYKVVSWTV